MVRVILIRTFGDLTVNKYGRLRPVRLNNVYFRVLRNVLIAFPFRTCPSDVNGTPIAGNRNSNIVSNEFDRLAIIGVRVDQKRNPE